MLFHIIRSLFFFSTFDFDKVSQHFTRLIITPFVSISWVLFIFLLIDLYNKVYIPENVTIANPMVFICIETFWYTTCTVIWQSIIHFYKNRINIALDKLFYVYNTTPINSISPYDVICILVLSTSYINTKVYLTLSPFILLFTIINNKYGNDYSNKNIDTPILVSNVLSNWEIVFDNLKHMLVKNKPIPESIYKMIGNTFDNHKDYLINNNIILQVDVEITDTPNTDSVLIINNDGDQKIYNSVDILIYNCKTEQEWQILTDVNSKCKLIQCKPNNNSLCTLSIINNLAVIIYN